MGLTLPRSWPGPLTSLLVVLVLVFVVASTRALRGGALMEATAPPRRPPGQAAGDERRTIGQLVAAARVIGEKRRRAEAERRAAEKARRDRKAAAEQEKHLDDLAKREPQTWAQVEALITSKPAKYEDVVSLLKDLRDLAARSDRTAAFAAKVADIRERFAKRPSLMERMDKAGFASRRDSA